MADTVELMRKRVLDMAVRGELVEQRPEEGMGSVTPISIVKNKKENQIQECETPYEIPSNWKWERLSACVHNNGQKKPDTAFSYIDISSIDNKRQKLGKDDNVIQPENAPSRARKIIKKGDILYSTVRPYLHNMCIVDREFSYEPIASTGFAVMATNEGLLNHYLFYYLLSSTFDAYANDSENATGTAYPAINDTKLYNAVVPLPPHQEQIRIVAKVEEIFAVIDKIGERKEEALKIIQNMRQTALQDAIMGVLVEQDELDEPASVLYEKIQAEKERLVKDKKIKKEKALPAIEADEVPFEIPESWKWVRLGDISNFGSHKSVKPDDISEEDLVYDLEDIESMSGVILRYKTMGESKSKSNKYVVSVGDILYSKLRPYLNKVAFAERNGYCTTEIFPLKFYGIAEGKYFMNFLRSCYFLSYANSNSQGTKMPRLGSVAGKNALVPLPPLAEQRRIVEKLDTIMAICDQMATIFDGSAEKVLEETLKND